MTTKPLDICVFGATGFTGTEVCLALSRGGAPGLTWAISGRSKLKLAALAQRCREESERHGCGLVQPPIIIADTTNEKQLVTMASKCRLVLNCTGPYRFFGVPVVRACVSATGGMGALTSSSNNIALPDCHAPRIKSSSSIVGAWLVLSEPNLQQPASIADLLVCVRHLSRMGLSLPPAFPTWPSRWQPRPT